MPNLQRENKTLPLWEKQGLHLILLLVLLVLTGFLAQLDGMQSGEFAGIKTPVWLMLALAVPVAHQIIVGLSWRAQLANRFYTRHFGENDFTVYSRLFMVFFIARPVTMIGLALANQGRLAVNPLILYGLAAILAIPAFYATYSVIRYFGIRRALGIDHFDPAYRDMPPVTEGIYRYSSNAMYAYVFLLLWIIGLLTASPAALLAAFFSHAYIWVHYTCTEKPDMDYIYGD